MQADAYDTYSIHTLHPLATKNALQLPPVQSPHLPAHLPGRRPPAPPRASAHPPAAPNAHLLTRAAALLPLHLPSGKVSSAICGVVGTLLCAALTQHRAADAGGPRRGCESAAE